jgi:protein-S-isoprenylcysteine O-methyltransferase Ste14
LPSLNFPKPYADRVAKLRVPGGFILVAAFAWFSHPTAQSLFIGFPVSIAGLILRAWAAGHLAKDRDLATSGPYAHVRNPLYIGTLFVAAGLVLASRSVALGVVFAAVFFLIYLPVIQLEEQHLRSLFPEYEKYSQQVPALIPRLTAAGGHQHFLSSLYWKNREYQALLGYLAGVALLTCKSIFQF